MKLQRNTLILVGIAFLLGAGVLITETTRPRMADDSGPEQSASRPLLDVSEADVVALTVERGEETLAFERDTDGNWQMVTPEQAPAEGGAVAFLLSQLTSTDPQQQVTMTPDQQGDFGLLSPSGRIELTLTDGSTRTVVLGGPAFSGDALYVLVDPATMPLPAEAGETPVYVVSQNLANGVERPVEEWKMATEADSNEADSDGDETEADSDPPPPEAEPPEAEAPTETEN